MRISGIGLCWMPRVIIAAFLFSATISASASAEHLSTANEISRFSALLGSRRAESASVALSAIGVGAIPSMERCSINPNWRVRYWSAAVLGHIGGPKVRKRLIMLSNDHDWRVRISAIMGWLEAYGKIESLPGYRATDIAHAPVAVQEACHLHAGPLRILR